MPEFTPDALIEVMKGASAELKAKVGVLVRRTVDVMQSDLRKAYMAPVMQHNTTGNLADHVDIREYHALMLQVRASAKHLHLYELGTKDRYAATRNKAPLSRPAFRGRASAHETFVPMAVARRAEMLHDAELLIGDREL